MLIRNGLIDRGKNLEVNKLSQLRTVHVRWMGGYRTDINIRGVHQLEGDEIPEYGGEDSGPMPTEFFLASISSCMCLAISHMAQKQRIQLNNIEVSANAEKDMQIFRFKEIHLEIQADLSPKKLDTLVQRAKKYCFVSNTIIHGCPIKLTSKSSLI